MPQTKQKIISSAVRLFSQDGYDLVSMRQIAADVGITGGSIYNHFKGKEAILDAIVEYLPTVLGHYAPTMKEIKQQLETQSVREILTRYITFYEGKDNSLLLPIYRLMYKEQFHNDKIKDAVQRFFIDEPVGNLQNTLDLLIQLEKIPPCDTKALAEIWSRTHLVYGIQASHDINLVDYGEYAAMGQFFIEAAVRGIPLIPVEQIEIKWTFPDLTEEMKPEQAKTKQRILMKSLDLFSEYGYNRVSVRQIADAVGIQGGSLYNHFTSKGEIMQAIVASLLTSYQQFRSSCPTFEASVDQDDPFRLVLSYAVCFPPVREEDVLKVYRILFREQFFNEDIRDLLMSTIYRDIESTARVLDEMAQAERIPPCDSRKIAIAYIHTMCSMTVGTTLFPEKRGKDRTRLRARTAALLASLVKNGYLN